MNEEILDLLSVRPMGTLALCSCLLRPETEVRPAIDEMVTEGRVRRRQDSRWAMARSEKQRRRRYPAHDVSPGNKTNARVDPSPFPRPSRLEALRTSHIGFFGPTSTRRQDDGQQNSEV